MISVKKFWIFFIAYLFDAFIYQINVETLYSNYEIICCMKACIKQNLMQIKAIICYYDTYRNLNIVLLIIFFIIYNNTSIN